MKTYTSVNKSSLWRLLFVSLPLLLALSCQAQQGEECYREVDLEEFRKLLPKEVCLEQGYHISWIYDPVDFNQDGLRDFIFRWIPINLSDGDTLYISVYLQQSDSTFTHYRTFDNLYPIYFISYGSSYEPDDPALAELLHEGYSGVGNPLSELRFIDDRISIRMEGEEAYIEFVATYLYTKEEKTWKLVTLKELDGFKQTSRELQSYRLGTDIREFNYVDYLNGNF